MPGVPAPHASCGGLPRRPASGRRRYLRGGGGRPGPSLPGCWSVRPGATGHTARVRVAASVKVRAGHAAVAAWAADLNESLRIGRSCGGSVSPFAQVDATLRPESRNPGRRRRDSARCKGAGRATACLHGRSRSERPQQTPPQSKRTRFGAPVARNPSRRPPRHNGAALAAAAVHRAPSHRRRRLSPIQSAGHRATAVPAWCWG